MGDLALIRAMQEAPPEVKRAALRLYKLSDKKEDTEAVSVLLVAARRQRQRQESDQVTDARRRTLAGARLPRETVERYRREAERRGLSMYAWVAEALRTHYARAQQQQARPADRSRSGDRSSREAHRRPAAARRCRGNSSGRRPPRGRLRPWAPGASGA